MRFRRLGRSGLVVSVAGLGCNNFGRRLDADGTREVVEAALDAGITLFDTSDSYGESEELLGAVLGGRRDDVVLATKFGSDLGGDLGADWGARGGRRYVRKAVERSLRRLRTDRIDLYQLHWPDEATPVEETLSALDDLVHEGKVGYVGCSNLPAWQVVDATWVARTSGSVGFVSVQDEYSLLERGAEDELIPACEHLGLGFIPYFPLASGVLTGKYRRGEPPPPGSRLERWGTADRLTDERFDVVERLEAFAAERSRSLVDVAIGALLARPVVASVIAGATTAEQVRANVAATAWEPTADDLATIDELTGPAPPA